MSRPHCMLRLALLALGGLSLACTLTFTPESAQSLRVGFELSSRLEEGRETVVQTLVFPQTVTLDGRLLSVAGALEREGAGALPGRLRLVAQSVDIDTGKQRHRLRLALKVAGDGTFSGAGRLAKKLTAGSMLTVSVEPLGAALERGVKIRLCVDLVERRADLATLTCPGAAAPGPTTFAAIQAEVFTPSCARAGCHDTASASAGLSLAAGEAYGQLVNVPSNQVPFRLRVEPGNPDNSYLMMKLRGSAGIEGVRMPLDGPPFLTDAQLDGIAAWIRAGAARN